MKNAPAIAAVTLAFLVYGCTHPAAPTQVPAAVALRAQAALPSAAPKPYTTKDIKAMILMELVGVDNGCEAFWLGGLSIRSATGIPDRYSFSCELYNLPEGDRNVFLDHVKGTCNPRTHDVHVTSQISDPVGGCFGLQSRGLAARQP
jgi:hypothetical protein